MTLLSKIKSINYDNIKFSATAVTKILIFGYNYLSTSSNTFFLNSAMDYVISTKIFDDSFLSNCTFIYFFLNDLVCFSVVFNLD